VRPGKTVPIRRNESLPGYGLGQLDLDNPEAIHYWYAEPKIFTGEGVPVPLKRNGERGSWLATVFECCTTTPSNVRVSLFWTVSDSRMGLFAVFI
jgi:hypothetical protein